jgi:hypothetical protein
METGDLQMHLRLDSMPVPIFRWKPQEEGDVTSHPDELIKPAFCCMP